MSTNRYVLRRSLQSRVWERGRLTTRIGIEGMRSGEGWEQNISFYFVTIPNPFNFWPVKPGPQKRTYGLILILVKNKTPKDTHFSE